MLYKILSGPNGTINPLGSLQVDNGADLNLTLQPNPGFKVDTFKVNGNIIQLTGNNYLLANINKSYKIEVKYKRTLTWLLMNKSWNEDSVIIRETDGRWFHYVSLTKDSVLFLPTGRFNIYIKGLLVGDGNWSIAENAIPPTLSFGGNWNLEKLDDVSLIISDFFGVKEIYTHH